MKRPAAIRNLNTVIKRLHSINGLLATPMHNHPFIKVRRAWVFGSVAKGKLEPNDVDVFVELVKPDIRKKYSRYDLNDGTRYDDLGRKVKYSRMVNGELYGLHGGYLLDVPLWKDTGLCFAKSAEECFVIWLKKRMPKVSIHIVGNDGSFDVLDTKYLVYPRCDFDMK